MAEGAIPLGRNDKVRVNNSDNTPGYIEDKVVSTDGSVEISTGCCDTELDLSVNGGFFGRWVKATINFSNFNTASTTVYFTPSELTGLPAGSSPFFYKGKHSVSFTGGGVTSCVVRLNHSGYNVGASTDVFVTPGDQVGTTSTTTGSAHIMSHGTVDDIQIELKTTGANASSLTQGIAEVWVYIVTLK